MVTPKTCHGLDRTRSAPSTVYRLRLCVVRTQSIPGCGYDRCGQHGSGADGCGRRHGLAPSDRNRATATRAGDRQSPGSSRVSERSNPRLTLTSADRQASGISRNEAWPEVRVDYNEWSQPDSMRTALRRSLADVCRLTTRTRDQAADVGTCGVRSLRREVPCRRRRPERRGRCDCS